MAPCGFCTIVLPRLLRPFDTVMLLCLLYSPLPIFRAFALLHLQTFQLPSFHEVTRRGERSSDACPFYPPKFCGGRLARKPSFSNARPSPLAGKMSRNVVYSLHEHAQNSWREAAKKAFVCLKRCHKSLIFINCSLTFRNYNIFSCPRHGHVHRTCPKNLKIWTRYSCRQLRHVFNTCRYFVKISTRPFIMSTISTYHAESSLKSLM